MLDLAESFRRIREFFLPQSLASTSINYTPAPGDITLASDMALLVIDVQKEFADPKGDRGNSETKAVSKRIRELVPEFRKAGIPTYVIYFSRSPKKLHQIDFYEFTPATGDVLVAKNRDSAFAGSNIQEILEKHGRKKLLACGFNLNACVYATVMDARKKGFEVSLLRDMTGNDNYNDGGNAKKYVDEMREQGIAMTRSSREIRKLNEQNELRTNTSAVIELPSPAV